MRWSGAAKAGSLIRVGPQLRSKLPGKRTSRFSTATISTFDGASPPPRVPVISCRSEYCRYTDCPRTWTPRRARRWRPQRRTAAAGPARPRPVHTLAGSALFSPKRVAMAAAAPMSANSTKAWFLHGPRTVSLSRTVILSRTVRLKSGPRRGAGSVRGGRAGGLHDAGSTCWGPLAAWSARGARTARTAPPGPPQPWRTAGFSGAAPGRRGCESQRASGAAVGTVCRLAHAGTSQNKLTGRQVQTPAVHRRDAGPGRLPALRQGWRGRPSRSAHGRQQRMQGGLTARQQRGSGSQRCLQLWRAFDGAAAACLFGSMSAARAEPVKRRAGGGGRKRRKRGCRAARKRVTGGADRGRRARHSWDCSRWCEAPAPSLVPQHSRCVQQGQLPDDVGRDKL